MPFIVIFHHGYLRMSKLSAQHLTVKLSVSTRHMVLPVYIFMTVYPVHVHMPHVTVKVISTTDKHSISKTCRIHPHVSCCAQVIALGPIANGSLCAIVAVQLLVALQSSVAPSRWCGRPAVAVSVLPRARHRHILHQARYHHGGHKSVPHQGLGQCGRDSGRLHAHPVQGNTACHVVKVFSKCHVDQSMPIHHRHHREIGQRVGPHQLQSIVSVERVGRRAFQPQHVILHHCCNIGLIQLTATNGQCQQYKHNGRNGCHGT
ncbi:hypothetical protein ORF012L [Spotted knifejaw iridovirus]|nr:hypothetical protein ORF012L [Spotted knifejaw iridovirus]